MLTKISQNYYYHFILACFGAMLISLSWYKPLTFLIFFALVPILLIEKRLYENQTPYSFWWFGLYSYIFLFLWNFGVYWWLWNASKYTTFAAWGLNSFFQTFPLLAYHLTKKTSNNRFGLFSLVVFWLSFEYLHLHWDFSWIWLNLGNVFHNTPEWVQWYEFTGTFGGSLWILVMNVWVYLLLTKGRGTVRLVLGLMPLIYSYLVFYQYQDVGKDVEIIVVQPNIDCYKEKLKYNAQTNSFNIETHIPYQDQVRLLLDIAKKHLTNQTQFIICPEAAIPEDVDERFINGHYAAIWIKDLLKQYPNASFVSGFDTYRFYEPTEQIPENATQNQSGLYFNVFNNASFFPDTARTEFYHKSKLVIGAETLPFPFIFKPLIVNLSGETFIGYAPQKEPSLFVKNGIAIAPIICYESVYGEYVSEFVRKGAHILSVMTNDGWWGNTSGHIQHFQYGNLRAIETRRCIARSANTGISGFIDQRGIPIETLGYEVEAGLRKTIKANDTKTFYTQFGDYIGRLAIFLAPFMLLAGLIRKKVSGKKIG